MDIIEFKKDFLEEVKTNAATTGEGSVATFVDVVSDYLNNSEVLYDVVPTYYEGKGKKNKKLRVDGYSYDQFDKTFTLIIANYTNSDSELTLTQSESKRIFDQLFVFLEECFDTDLINKIEPSNPVVDLIELIRYNHKKNKINKFKFLLFTDQTMSKRIVNIETLNFKGIPVERQIWDIERIYKNCSNIDGKQNIQINFSELLNSNGIPCIKTSLEGYNSFLCIIPGNVVADLYDKYGSQLLEGNVRSFLSTKVAVNKKIRETILKCPENFFAFNNGIAATARNIKITNNQNGFYISYAEDFQIINGGQTTASLSNSRFKDKADLSKIFVQMKLTEIDTNIEKTNEFIRNISKSSNSQSKVSDVDFFSTHPFHIRMEQISKRVWAPAKNGEQFETRWFYERARGQFIQAQMHLSKAQKKSFLLQNPKKQLITKPLLAKVRNSWNMLPHIVSKGAQANFLKFAEVIDEEWLKNDKIFNDKYYKDSVTLFILFKFTESLVSKQSWYEGGYRANIVTYSIALFRYLLNQQYPKMQLDFQKIWNEQKIPIEIEDELIKITKFVNNSITDPSRQTINVTQWCKRQVCWIKIKEAKISLNENITNCLISKEENKKEIKSALADQEIYSDIEAQTKILEFNKDYWIKIDHFFYNNQIDLNNKDLEAINLAKQIPRKLPSGFQSKRLLSLIDCAESNGFKYEEDK